MHWKSSKRIAVIGFALLAMIVSSAADIERPGGHAPIHAMSHQHASHDRLGSEPCKAAGVLKEQGEGDVDCCSPAHCQTLLPISQFHLVRATAVRSVPTHIAPVAMPRDQELTDPPPRSLSA